MLILGGNRIHQSKSWYYLGPFWTSKVELFAKIVFGYKPLTFFVKNSNQMFDLFYKTLPINTFYVLLAKILHLEKKHVISTPVCLSLLFQENWFIKRGWASREGVCNKKGLVEHIKIFIWERGTCGKEFFPHPRRCN